MTNVKIVSSSPLLLLLFGDTTYYCTNEIRITFFFDNHLHTAKRSNKQLWRKKQPPLAHTREPHCHCIQCFDQHNWQFHLLYQHQSHQSTAVWRGSRCFFQVRQKGDIKVSGARRSTTGEKQPRMELQQQTNNTAQQVHKWMSIWRLCEWEKLCCLFFFSQCTAQWLTKRWWRQWAKINELDLLFGIHCQWWYLKID
jgi:hypothetical protein